MKFRCRYLPRKGDAREYWKTVIADDLKEASDRAELYRRKGFICASVVRDDGCFKPAKQLTVKDTVDSI